MVRKLKETGYSYKIYDYSKDERIMKEIYRIYDSSNNKNTKNREI